MSVVAYAHGHFGADRTALVRIACVPTATDMQKAFVSATNDFFYGYSGLNLVKRHHPLLQSLARRLISDVLAGRPTGEAIKRLEESFPDKKYYMFVTKKCVITIEGEDRTLAEHEIDSVVAIGSGALVWRVAYEFYGRFKHAMRESSHYANGVSSDPDFYHVRQLGEFVPCE